MNKKSWEGEKKERKKRKINDLHCTSSLANVACIIHDNSDNYLLLTSKKLMDCLCFTDNLQLDILFQIS